MGTAHGVLARIAAQRLGGGGSRGGHIASIVDGGHVQHAIFTAAVPFIQERLDQFAEGVSPADPMLARLIIDRLVVAVEYIHAALIQFLQYGFQLTAAGEQDVAHLFQPAFAQADQAECLQHHVAFIALVIGQHEALFHVTADAQAAVADGAAVLMGFLIAHRQFLQGAADHQQVVIGQLKVLDHLAELVCRRLHCAPGIVRLLLHAQGLFLGSGHGTQHLLHQVIDLIRSVTDLDRQVAHLVGHHRKAAPLLAGPGRFDGGVQCQHVGLGGKILDRGQDLADLSRAGIQRIDIGLEAGHRLADLLHACTGFAQLRLRRLGALQVARGHAGDIAGARSDILQCAAGLVAGLEDQLGQLLLRFRLAFRALGQYPVARGRQGDAHALVLQIEQHAAQPGTETLECLAGGGIVLHACYGQVDLQRIGLVQPLGQGRRALRLSHQLPDEAQ